MKKYILLLVLFCSVKVTAQYLTDQVDYAKREQSYSTLVNSGVAEYYYSGLDSGISGKQSFAIQHKLLNENLDKAFNTIVFGSTGLVNSASSFGYSQNKDKTNVTVNLVARPFPKIEKYYLDNFYLTFGGTVEGSGTVFDFYSSNEWHNKVTANAGITFKLSGSSFFTPNEKGKRFEDFKYARRYMVQKTLENWDKIKEQRESLADKRKDLLQELNTEIETLSAQGKTGSSGYIEKKRFYDILMSADPEDKGKSQTIIADYIINELLFSDDTTKKQKAQTLIKNFPKVQELIKKETNGAAYTLLIKEMSELDSIVDAQLQGKFIKNKFYEFDKENDITYGYSFFWLSANVGVSNSTFNFTKDNIPEELLPRFQNDFPDSDEINKVSVSTLISLNWNRNGKKWVWFAQGGFTTQSSSFLDSQLVDGDVKLGENDEGEFILIDDRERDLPNGLGKFNQIEKTIHTGSAFLYGAFFTGKSKNIGFNASLKYTTNLSSIPDNIYFENNRTFLFGPIFRTVKDDNTSISFGIDVGWENVPTGDDTSEDFIGRVRLGIPFGIFKKGKSEKKS